MIVEKRKILYFYPFWNCQALGASQSRFYLEPRKATVSTPRLLLGILKLEGAPGSRRNFFHLLGGGGGKGVV